MTLIIADLVLLVPAFIHAVVHPSERPRFIFLIARGTEFGVVHLLDGLAWILALIFFPFALLALALCARQVLALGLDVHQRRRVTSILLSHSTSRRQVWKRPEIAQLLLPPKPAGSASTEPRLPGDIVDALARESPARAEEARALAAELAALDAEIARLASDGDPDEAARLRQRLTALGPESAQEGEERRALRRLLNEQARLLERVAARLSEARARRDERAEALRGLWRAAHGADAATRTRSTLRADSA